MSAEWSTLPGASASVSVSRDSGTLRIRRMWAPGRRFARGALIVSIIAAVTLALIVSGVLGPFTFDHLGLGMISTIAAVGGLSIGLNRATTTVTGDEIRVSEGPIWLPGMRKKRVRVDRIAHFEIEAISSTHKQKSSVGSTSTYSTVRYAIIAVRSDGGKTTRLDDRFVARADAAAALNEIQRFLQSETKP